jgi:hydrogenase-4 component F
MMVGVLILTLAVAPALAVIGCLASRRPRVAEALNVIASAVSFASAMPLPFLIDGQQLLFWNDYIIMDRLSAWVILCTSIVYFLASIYAVGTCGF